MQWLLFARRCAGPICTDTQRERIRRKCSGLGATPTRTVSCNINLRASFEAYRLDIPTGCANVLAPEYYLPPPENTLPSGMITSPGFIPAGQLPRYFISMTVTFSELPFSSCISIWAAVSPTFE